MKDITEGLVTVAVAIVGIAIIAVLVSQRSQTAQVLQAAGGAFATSVSAAVSPVTGGSGFGSGLGFTGGGPLINPTSF